MTGETMTALLALPMSLGDEAVPTDLPCDECDERLPVSKRITELEHILQGLQAASVEQERARRNDILELTALVNRRHGQARKLIMDHHGEIKTVMDRTMSELRASMERTMRLIEGSEPEKSVITQIALLKDRLKLYDKIFFVIAPMAFAGLVGGLWAVVMHYLPKGVP